MMVNVKEDILLLLYFGLWKSDINSGNVNEDQYFLIIYILYKVISCNSMEKQSPKCENNFWETIGDLLVDDISVLNWEITKRGSTF